MDATPQRRPQTVLYAELHLKTNFSFLEGASHPDELVHRAAELGYAALAVTDRNSLAGVVRAHTAAKQMQLKLLVGAEITPLDAPPVVLLATDRAAYGRLVRLITLGRRNAPKGECRIRFDDLAAHAAGLIAVVGGAFDKLAPGSAGGAGGEPVSIPLQAERGRESFPAARMKMEKIDHGNDSRPLQPLNDECVSISLRPPGGPSGEAGGYEAECDGMATAVSSDRRSRSSSPLSRHVRRSLLSARRVALRPQ